MRRPLIAGNWKMNGSRALARELIETISTGLPVEAEAAEVLVCPSFVLIPELTEFVRTDALELGAQNVSEYDEGAYTGEVSAAMLRDYGCRYAIVGHSERRQLFGETDAQVAAKFVAAQRQGLRPVLCVGETLEERDGGRTEQVIDAQLEAVLEVTGISAFAEAVVAYEPVWAIGTGKTASPEQAQAVHARIRGLLAGRDESIAAGLRILYGGSMKAANAEGLLAMADIDGGLIGGASLKAEEFLTLCRLAARR